MTLTDEMVAQLNGYSERFRIVTLQQWKARGYDLGEHGKVLEGPSLARRVVNFGKAMVAHAKNGCCKVPIEEQERRLALCKGCEFYGLKKPGVCGHKDCGCPMGRKVELASSFCPADPPLWGKWSADCASNVDPAGPGNPALVDPVEELNQPPLVESGTLAPAVHVLDGTVADPGDAAIPGDSDSDKRNDKAEFRKRNDAEQVE